MLKGGISGWLKLAGILRLSLNKGDGSQWAVF